MSTPPVHPTSLSRTSTPTVWLLIGAGAALFLGLILLATVLDVGERLGRLHVAVEYLFYVLVAAGLYGLLVRPIMGVFATSTVSLQRFLVQDASLTPREYRTVAKRLLKTGGLSHETTTRLNAALASGADMTGLMKVVIEEKSARATKIVKEHARLAFVSTAVLQNGSLDAVMLAYANLKMVRALVAHFGYRPSLPALVTMYGQILAAALLAERVEDMQLEDIFPQFSASVGGGVISAIPGMHLIVHALLQGMGSAFLTLRTGYLAEEYILRGAEAFDRRRERKSASRRAAKDLLGVVVSTAAQLPASMRTILKAVNVFRDPVPQPL
ncbi:MAG: DUF697 domain-containing protein [Nitrospiraceae bacterium]